MPHLTVKFDIVILITPWLHFNPRTLVYYWHFLQVIIKHDRLLGADLVKRAFGLSDHERAFYLYVE
jgi:hypothetical protein